MGDFYSFWVIFHKYFAVLKSFLENFSKKSRVVGVHTVFGTSVDVGVPADASVVVGSTVVRPTAVANFLVVSSCWCCWGPWWMLLASSCVHSGVGLLACCCWLHYMYIVQYFCKHPSFSLCPHCVGSPVVAVTTRNNTRASTWQALYSVSAIRQLTSKSGNTFI